VSLLDTQRQQAALPAVSYFIVGTNGAAASQLNSWYWKDSQKVTPMRRFAVPYGRTIAPHSALQLQPFSDATIIAQGIRNTMRIEWFAQLTM
jgi:hypothetical protein